MDGLCYYCVETDEMTRQEFDIFSESIRGKLLSVARRFSRSGEAGADEAEDAVQEALTTLWRLYEDGYPVRDGEALAVKITKSASVAGAAQTRMKK